ncbi:MAG: NAD(P)H-dependent oxidoreductase [Betaproteobacteria bacterium]|nr:NAD(P)H-dependent oxidoreductase [Betaproteobacteria bacterium]
MKIGIISGSHRINSQSMRIACWIEKRLTALALTQRNYTLELATANIPLWDEGLWNGDEKWKGIWGKHSQELISCDSFVFVAPEYGGMVPPALKNFFLLCSNQELAHKPALIVGVSAGRSGSYPIVELRSSGYKNTRICYLPDHMIIRDAEKMFLNDEPRDNFEASDRARLDYFLRVLKEYAKALSTVRASGIIDVKNFPNGL